MEDVKSFVLEALPSISSEELNVLLETLSALGVEACEDFQHIEPKDLTTSLKLIQIRKLMKKIDGTFNRQDTVFIQPQVVEIVQQSTSVEEGPELVVQPNSDTESLFEKIPFQRFPKVLLSRLEKGERPTPSERREVVRIIVAAVMEHIPAPRKKHLEAVAMGVIRRYPESFKDTIGNDSIGLGHSSLLCQLIARAENCRRTSGPAKRKVNEGMCGAVAKRLADSYGCINYQPSDFPEGEGEESQKEKKIFMQSEFQKVFRDLEKVKQYMIDTYVSQRIQINSKAPIPYIIKEWPFLTERKFLFEHTENLVGFSLKEKFETAIREKLEDLMNYARSIDKELNFRTPHLYILQILTTLFNEELGLLMKIYENDKSLVDVKEEAPFTPFIACTGNPFELASVCTVFIEKEQFEANIPLDDALLMWFSAFYTFNLIYPKECCATLEFIQRAFFGINPESKGSKMEKRFGKRVAIHPKVLKLINNIKNFSSKWNL